MSWQVVLFLDLDGVLHPIFPHPELPDSENALLAGRPRLWRVLRQCPWVCVVISSTWRETRSLEKLRRLLTEGGGEDLEGRFVGVTPMLEGAGALGHREVECRAWLEAQGHRGPWLALDDHKDGFLPGAPVLFTDADWGLREEEVPRVIAVLQTLVAAPAWNEYVEQHGLPLEKYRQF